MHRVAPQSHPSSVTLQQELQGQQEAGTAAAQQMCSELSQSSLTQQDAAQVSRCFNNPNKKTGQGLSRQHKRSCRQMCTTRLHFYKRTRLLGQNSALASAKEGKLGVGECVLAAAMKQFISKCLMGPKKALCDTKMLLFPYHRGLNQNVNLSQVQSITPCCFNNKVHCIILLHALYSLQTSPKMKWDQGKRPELKLLIADVQFVPLNFHFWFYN